LKNVVAKKQSLLLLFFAFVVYAQDSFGQCYIGVQPEHLEASCVESLTQVVWTDLVNASQNEGSLSKTAGGTNWNSGAASITNIGFGGSAMLVVETTNQEKTFGLSEANGGSDQNSIRHAFHLRNNGELRIREFNSNRGNFGNYSIGDTLTIVHSPHGAEYYRNNSLLYVSNLAPATNLIADVSLRSNGATLGAIFLTNPTSGTFQFIGQGSGTGSNFEWFLDGITAGISNQDFTVASPQAGSEITCLLSPGVGSCFGADTLTVRSVLRERITPESPEIYISAFAAAQGCFEYTEEVIWDRNELNNVDIIGGDLQKFDGGNNWNGGAYSLNAVHNNGSFQFIASETNRRRMIGLSDSNIDNNWSTIDFAFYLENNGNLSIRESGANRGNYGGYSSGDTLKIALENGIVHYYRNGQVIRVSSSVNTSLFVDVSIRDEWGTIQSPIITNLGTGTVSATATNLGSDPVYQWLLNNIPVGTNSAIYDGPSLSDQDVLRCEISPDQNTCDNIAYATNTISVREVSVASNTNFFIAGELSTLACQQISEEVVWNISSVQNCDVEGNLLTKIQGNGQWNAGASSLNQVGDGGFVEIVVAENNRRRMIGLSDNDLNTDWTSIDYAFYLEQNTNLSIRENGANRGTYGTYATGDTLRISIENSMVYYYKNGDPIRVATASPNLPLIVDVSMRDVGATTGQITVTNYNEGNFTAIASDVGLNPIYEWRLNGSTVGSNSPNYSNPNIVGGDELTCILTPDLAGCNGISYTSNLIELMSVPVPDEINFYIAGEPVVSSCQQITEEVVWDNNSSTNVQTNGNSVEKIQSNGQWNGGIASLNRVANDGYVEFIATETNRRRMLGLSSTNVNSDWTTIQYAFYLEANGNVGIRENGTNRGTFGTYTTGDVFRIAVENETIYYYRNGNILRIAPSTPSLPLIVDVSIRDVGGTFDHVLIGNKNSGGFEAFASNAGANPQYQWRLNGNPVGSNSNLYTNPNIVDGDEITCELTPDLGGCSSVVYTSNVIASSVLSDPPAINFYIASDRVSNACQQAREEVVWDLSSISNADADGNNLIKVQNNGQWNGGASSINTIVDNASFEFIASETNRRRMVGVSDVDQNVNFSTIDFAFYLEANGNLRIFESGANRGNFGTYSIGDTMRIAVENNTIHYYRNQDLLRISPVTPSLPLIADVSLRDVGASVTNAVIITPDGGMYTANASNVGANPSYQWYLNGNPVGSNTSSYSNPNINAGDQISCELSPDLGGCSVASYMSNAISLLQEPQLEVILPVATNQPTTAGYAYAEEDIVWDPNSLQNVESNLNDVVKIQSNGQWNGGAASLNRVYAGGYLEFTTNESNRRKYVGLSAVDNSSNQTSIQYAFSLEGNGTLRIFESGANRGNYGSYSPGDVLRISYESGTISYFRNGVLLRTASTTSFDFLVDVSIRDVGGSVSQAIVGNLSNGNFSISAEGSVSPTFQWQLNGSNVGSGSSNYSNMNLVDGDVVTCTVSPSFAGCQNEDYVSNIIRIQGPAAATTWTGAVNNNWSNEGNWTLGTPNQFITAVIPGAPSNQPVLSSTSQVNDVEIRPGGQLSLSNHSLLIHGNFDAQGSFNAQTGTVVFTGIGEALASGEEITFYRLVINKTNPGEGLTLETPIRIQDETVFIRGNIRATTHEVIYEDNADSRTGLNASHIEGFARKIGNDAFTFPVGRNGIYAPLGISAPSSVATEFVASYYDTDPNEAGFTTSQREADLVTLSSCEYWILDREVGSSPVFVTLGYEYERSCGTSEPSELLIARWNGAQWENHGYSSHSGDSLLGGVVSGEAVVDFSPFTFGSGSFNNPLPIELIEFDVKKANDVAIVSWKTASESNNDYFTIERSKDGIAFERVGFVNGSGTSTSTQVYSFVDEEPMAGTSYYRLKQTDFDGNFETFAPVAVHFDGSQKHTLFPNPASEKVHILFAESSGKTVRLINSSGVVVSTFFTENTEFQIDLNSYATGLYFVEVISDGESQISKLIVE
jgi:hypothetical protein